MFESVGWGEILVLALIGLFILGPERLPGAIRWVAETVRTVRDYATGAKEQLRSELGPEFEQFREPLEDLRAIRSVNPRTAVRRAFLDPVSDGTWTGAATPANADPGVSAATGGAVAGGAAALATGSGTNGTGRGVPAAGADGVVKGQSDRALPLRADEQAPFDPDAT